MIKVIGYRRFLLLLVLTVALAGLALGNMYVLQPQLQQQERQLSATRGDVALMRTNLDQLIEGFNVFERQKDVFVRVQKTGFFDAQNRKVASLRINAMQEESRLLSAQYSIKKAVDIKSEKAEKAGYKVLKTPLEFNLFAYEDADIYKFIYLLNYGFPGQVLMTNVSFVKDKNVTQPTLRQIGAGEPTPLVRASIKADWYTMVSDESLAVNGEVEGGQ